MRGHQAVQDGYEFSAEKRCLTIFSAPAYCGEQDNLAGILAISKHLECVIYTFKGVGKNVATITQAQGEKEPSSPGTPVTAVSTAQTPPNKSDSKNTSAVGGGEKGKEKDGSKKENKDGSGKEKVKK